MYRSDFLNSAAAAALFAVCLGMPAAFAGDKPKMTVYKSPSCGCCVAWVKHMRKAGYTVETVDKMTMVPTKKALSVPNTMWACHTAVVDGRVIEGHVPASAVDQLLAEKTKIYGIAAPGMPAGSPGMGDDPAARYDVVTFEKDSADQSRVFRRYGQ